MTHDTEEQKTDKAQTKRVLTPAAQRALAEAEDRRRSGLGSSDRPRELAGRGGAEPVRYGDWEVKGLATDF